MALFVVFKKEVEIPDAVIIAVGVKYGIGAVLPLVIVQKVVHVPELGTAFYLWQFVFDVIVDNQTDERQNNEQRKEQRAYEGRDKAAFGSLFFLTRSPCQSQIAQKHEPRYRDEEQQGPPAGMQGVVQPS